MTGAAARQTLRAVRVDARSLVAAGILVAGWEFLPRRGVLNPAYFPPASQVVAALAEGLSAGELLPHVAATVSRLLVAFFLAALPGLGAGVAMGLSGTVRRVADPYVALLYPIPKVALLPLMLILFGVGERAFVLTGALTAFFQIVVNTMDGIRQVDPTLVEVGRNYGATGFRLFWKVVLPAALPGILTGLRLGLGLTLVTVVAVEFAIAKSGLGHVVWGSWQTLTTPRMYAAFVAVGILGLLLTRGLKRLQDRLLAWQTSVDVW